MPIDPRTPVLVGAGAVQQKLEDPREAKEPIELILEALERAAEDAGSRELLERATTVRMPRGFWDYPDPGRFVAERFGARLRSEVAELGILQTTLFGRSAGAIASGEEDVVLIAGGEAKYRSLRAQILGIEAPLTRQASDVAPDEVLRPHDEILSQAELAHGLGMPVGQYALMENALRFAEKKSIDEHVREVAETWAGMSRVAATNPLAWNPEPVSAETIATPTAKNRMLAFPYTRLHNSQWNVDQAAGLILCSVQTAKQLGIREDRWLFPLAAAESNHMVPLCERAVLHRSPGFRIGFERALAHAGLGAAELDHVELYSCFPVAVRIQLRELGLSPTRPLTVTGGMAFGGGPLNNFALQAMARMADVLRGAPGTTGMVTAVSGMLTKQGVTLWSTRPPERPFSFLDVTADVARELVRVPFAAEYAGPATVASCTVLHGAAEPTAVFLCDTPEGGRTLASSRAPEMLRSVEATETCGRTIQVACGAVQ
ncbi:MAG: acetyl-CoA acetyltransferase [Deltaproteobacteria bacterium]|nr:acetyl-CoA acetyltransferase [Deltaproteobacteria bacterium]